MTQAQFDEECLQGLKDYIEYFKSLAPEEAREEARKSLIRCGIMDENEKIKDDIRLGKIDFTY